ncbi:MAG: 1-acyl-sn-glycerol-3-phosphate acyltransferase [Anaerolineae bacterium]|nr:1-acyl-sn-glycerol-3-phosphate acyltransferase [Anaerolineae bacterium]
MDRTEEQLTTRGRWLRLGKRLGGERLLFVAGRVLYCLRIEGAEKIPTTGPCLLPFNHVSQPADLLANALIRRRRPDMCVFGWQGLRGENPLVHFVTALGEPYPDDWLLRAYKARALSAGELLRALRLVQAGAALSIAAEGEITWDGRLQHPLAPGAAWLALRTGAPVVPIVSLGGYDLQPRWQMERIRLNGRLTIRVGRPFALCDEPVTRPDDETLQAANERLWQEMAALLKVSSTPGRGAQYAHHFP